MSHRKQNGFRIDWDLHELGPRAEGPPVYRDVSADLDFSRLDYGRAVAAGYAPANERRYQEDAA
jgi:hypothetical protein